MANKYNKNYFYVDLSDIHMLNPMEEEADLKALADKYEIPEKFQKIVMVYNKKYSSTSHGLYELVSGHPFNHYRYEMFVPPKKAEDGIAKFYGVRSSLTCLLRIDSKLVFRSSDEIIRFYEELINSDLFDKYQSFMYKMFGSTYKNYAPSLDERLIDLVKGGDAERYESIVLSRLDNKRREKMKNKKKK